ncbi:MAG: hypothetical protein DMF24_08595 [Verrucomicrobia bacterium]|nr:MAG: hypothetical protein DME90_11775 [Verrucomicrobiota bacterium]PYL60982.1 MAG: hypothetical protein DMF24_08595 [Verrucomicrobiota bacterium]
MKIQRSVEGGQLWEARASRVLASASHDRELFPLEGHHRRATCEGKTVSAQRRNQHAGRVRSPERWREFNCPKIATGAPT